MNLKVAIPEAYQYEFASGACNCTLVARHFGSEEQQYYVLTLLPQQSHRPSLHHCPRAWWQALLCRGKRWIWMFRSIQGHIPCLQFTNRSIADARQVKYYTRNLSTKIQCHTVEDIRFATLLNECIFPLVNFSISTILASHVSEHSQRSFVRTRGRHSLTTKSSLCPMELYFFWRFPYESITLTAGFF